MAINNIATSVRNTMCDALVDAIDGGAGAGTLKGYTTAFGTLLFTLTFSDPAFGAAATGVATANAITDESNAPASGTAAVLRVEDSDPATVFEGTIGSGSGDLDLNTTTIAAADVVSCSSATITQPAG